MAKTASCYDTNPLLEIRNKLQKQTPISAQNSK